MYTLHLPEKIALVCISGIFGTILSFFPHLTNIHMKIFTPRNHRGTWSTLSWGQRFKWVWFVGVCLNLTVGLVGVRPGCLCLAPLTLSRLTSQYNGLVTRHCANIVRKAGHLSKLASSGSKDQDRVSKDTMDDPQVLSSFLDFCSSYGLDSTAVIPSDGGQPSECPEGSIEVKTIIFQALGKPFVVVLRKGMTADYETMAAHLHLPKRQVTLAGVRFAEELTGFRVRTIPPFGHRKPLRTLVDRGLAGYSAVVGGCGHRDYHLCVSLDDLLRATRGEMVDLVGGATNQDQGGRSSKTLGSRAHAETEVVAAGAGAGAEVAVEATGTDEGLVRGMDTTPSPMSTAAGPGVGEEG
ncbi:unnamed protein product, partial [Discosporangium mesarthrocarpum]